MSTDRSLKLVLDVAGPKPPIVGTSADAKKNYSEVISKEFSRLLKDALLALDPETYHGLEVDESEIETFEGNKKKIDVLLTNKRQGLGLNVSVKTLNWPDLQGKTKVKTTKKYCKNITRVIEQELKTEVQTCHDRFPYAVVIAVILMPYDACEDANKAALGPVEKRKPGDCSSFAEFSLRLGQHVGRLDPHDQRTEDKFEDGYIGLYWPEPEGERGSSLFHHAGVNPPRIGVAAASMFEFPELVKRIDERYKSRNLSQRRFVGE